MSIIVILASNGTLQFQLPVVTRRNPNAINIKNITDAISSQIPNHRFAAINKNQAAELSS